MKVKTSELLERILDWAVAKCEGRCTDIEELDGKWWWVLEGNFNYEYSTRWDAGGPIIERERIHLAFDQEWVATTDNMFHHIYGPTPLVAAMRCYVASKLGNEVDIPEELLNG